VLLVVGLTVLLVVGATVLLVVGLTVLLVVGATVLLVVGLTVDVVVPPVGVADASCPTLTPATTSVAMITSQPAVRLRTFFTCLAIDPYLSRQRPTDRGPLPRQTRQPAASASGPNSTGHGGC
jgi:hypothetical protein